MSYVSANRALATASDSTVPSTRSSAKPYTDAGNVTSNLSPGEASVSDSSSASCTPSGHGGASTAVLRRVNSIGVQGSASSPVFAFTAVGLCFVYTMTRQPGRATSRPASEPYPGRGEWDRVMGS